MESDEVLVERSRNGDVSAFESLVARYERSAFSVARSVLGNMYLAEECVQEAFVAAWSAMASLKEPSRFGAWLMSISKRKALRVASSEQRHLSDCSYSEAEPEDWAAESARVTELFEMLERLPEDERLLLTMHYFDGHSARDISVIIGRPVGTVTKMMSRAYDKLRKMPWSTSEVKNDS